MAKDAKGHGSEKRGGGGMSAAEEAQNRSGISWAKHARANFEAGKAAQSGAPIFGKADASEFAKRIGTGELHTQEIAAQHGLPTSIWNRPAGSSMNMVSNAAQSAALNRTYLRNEDRNAHAENYALLAKNFGTPAEHAQAKEIISERNRIGYLPDSTKSVPNVREWNHDINQRLYPKLMGR